MKGLIKVYKGQYSTSRWKNRNNIGKVKRLNIMKKKISILINDRYSGAERVCVSSINMHIKYDITLFMMHDIYSIISQDIKVIIIGNSN